MSDKLPKPYQDFMKNFPVVGKNYEALGQAVHAAGPLDEKTRALVKLAVSVGGQTEGAVHAHTRKALKAGVSADEIRHAVLLSLPTIGFPRMMAALSWVNDVLE